MKITDDGMQRVIRHLKEWREGLVELQGKGVHPLTSTCIDKDIAEIDAALKILTHVSEEGE